MSEICERSASRMSLGSTSHDAMRFPPPHGLGPAIRISFRYTATPSTPATSSTRAPFLSLPAPVISWLLRLANEAPLLHTPDRPQRLLSTWCRVAALTLRNLQQC